MGAGLLEVVGSGSIGNSSPPGENALVRVGPHRTGPDCGMGSGWPDV